MLSCLVWFVQSLVILPEIGHETDERRVPFVDDLGEGRRTGGHQDLTDSVVEPWMKNKIDEMLLESLEFTNHVEILIPFFCLLGHGFIIYSQEALGRPLFGDLVLQIPYTIPKKHLYLKYTFSFIRSFMT